MMVEKEVGVYESAHFPSIWTPFKAPNGELRHVYTKLTPCFLLSFLTLTLPISYQNIVTETFRMTRPPPIGGGILADVA